MTVTGKCRLVTFYGLALAVKRRLFVFLGPVLRLARVPARITGVIAPGRFHINTIVAESPRWPARTWRCYTCSAPPDCAAPKPVQCW